MDQHDEKADSNSTGQRGGDAAAAAEGSSGESMDHQREGCNKAEESAPGHLLDKEAGSGGGSSPSPPALFAHPCSLLQLLLRACAGCLGLHGYCSRSDDPKPPAAGGSPEAPAAADSSQEGEGGGEKANDFYMQGEVITRVWAVRRPRPPGGHPREGSGVNGGVHH